MASYRRAHVLIVIDACRYRAPECLLTDGHYGHKMDMWSVGCVLFELMRYVQQKQANDVKFHILQL